MLVQLDETTWEVSDTLRLDEVLANVSDRAEAQGRLVTQLMIGNRAMTDRDLVPPTLSQVASSFGSIEAKSERMESLIQHSANTGKKYGQQIRSQAQSLVEDFRNGKGVMRQTRSIIWANCGLFGMGSKSVNCSWSRIQYTTRSRLLGSGISECQKKL